MLPEVLLGGCHKLEALITESSAQGPLIHFDISRLDPSYDIKYPAEILHFLLLSSLGKVLSKIFPGSNYATSEGKFMPWLPAPMSVARATTSRPTVRQRSNICATHLLTSCPLKELSAKKKQTKTPVIALLIAH